MRNSIFTGLVLALFALPSRADEPGNAPVQAGSGQAPAPNIVPLSDTIPLPMPAFGKSNPLLSPDGPSQKLAPLSALAPGSIEVSVKTTDSKYKGFIALTISAKNNTDRPLMFNGNEAAATMGGESLKALPTSAINDRINQPDNPKGYTQRSIENTITAAVALGAIQTVEGELQRRGPIASRYGFDNIRRDERQARFAERILWPGDSTVGVVYFKSDRPLNGASLQIPVSDFYDKKDSTTIPATVQ